MTGVTLDDTKRLDELYRAKVKLTEQETGILHQPPDDLINKMGILNALAAREDTQAPARGSAASKQRGSKRSAVDSESTAVESPGPSPSDVRTSDQLRRVKAQGQRSSSVASQTPRDSISKPDDGADTSRSAFSDRAKMLLLHAEVAYKQSKTTHDSDGERIHCTINGIRKEKGRYAVVGQRYSVHEQVLICMQRQGHLRHQRQGRDRKSLIYSAGRRPTANPSSGQSASQLFTRKTRHCALSRNNNLL
jgi:hypothetical protein